MVDDANLERARVTSRRAAEKSARQRLYNIYDLPTERDADCRGHGSGGRPEDHRRPSGNRVQDSGARGTVDAEVGLVDILDASGVRARLVRFKDGGKWWCGDSNAMLAFRAEDGQPVALLPGTFGRYRQIDPISGRSVRVTAERAGALENEAWMFYRPLPLGQVKPTDLLRFALQGSGADLVRLVMAGLPGGLIKLLPALALGFVANHIVAGGSTGAIYAVAATLAGIGLLGAMLHLLQSTAMMRIEGRAASRVEAAFWDRLMRLPPAVLRRHPAGDLAMSGMTFQNLRDGVQGVVADSLLSIVFLLPVFGVIFLLRRHARRHRSHLQHGLTADHRRDRVAPDFALRADDRRRPSRCRAAVPDRGRYCQAPCGKRGGVGFRHLGARLSRAENARSSNWARRKDTRGHSEPRSPFLPAGCCFAQRQRWASGTARLAIFSSSTPSSSHSSSPSPGSASPSAPSPPCCRRSIRCARCSPRFPRTESEGEPVERLGGDVLFDHVSFRYEPDGPLILDDVTIRAEPGDFVAIAGESGAGKSTLFRLALGIDRPTAGRGVLRRAAT